MAAQSKYTEDTADLICERLAEGVSLAEICRVIGVHRSVVYDWRKAHDGFAERMDTARDLGYDAIADDCLRIADDGSADMTTDDEGNERVDFDHIQRSKLRVHTRLQLLAKWSPRYREKVQQELSGPDGGPIKQSIDVTFHD